MGLWVPKHLAEALLNSEVWGMYTTPWTEDWRREGVCPGPLRASVSLEPLKAPALGS